MNAVHSDDENVLKYISKGETEKINERHLTAKRSPWYALERRPPAPIWVSVFNRTGLRFIRNEAEISNLTTFHCVYPRKDLFSEVTVDLLFAYLLTDTARQIFEDNCREYGNGLQKFEPNDLNKGQLLDLNLLPPDKKQEIVVLYRLYAEDRDKRHITQINNLILEQFAV